MGAMPDDPASTGDDPFHELLDPSFANHAVLREASAQDRARAAERIARQADLQRRLEQQQVHDIQAARRQRRTVRRSHGRARFRRIGSIALLVAIVGGLVWVNHSSGSGGGLFGRSNTKRPTGYPPVDKSASSKPLGTPPAAPNPAGPYEFMMTQQHGSGPVAWDPCRPVRFVVNPAGAPASGDAAIRDAISRVASATGLTFLDAGTTTELWSKDREPYQPDRYGKKWAPLLISWSNETATPSLGGYVDGIGGATPRSDTKGNEIYVSGQLVLDSQDLAQLLVEDHGADRVRAVVQHELGHVIGLDHVADPKQLMYTEGSPLQTDEWGNGDLAGLRLLGMGHCWPDI